MDLIRLKNVSKQYKNGVTAIYDLTLSIKKGSFVFVIGGSGSGKSTFIKMLYREEKPTSGEIYVGGINVAKLRNKNYLNKFQNIFLLYKVEIDNYQLLC